MPYVYEQFPCWVTHEDGKQTIVHSNEQFDALGDGWKKPPEYVSPGFGPGATFIEYPKWVGAVLVHDKAEEDALNVQPDSVERDALIQIAAEKGVKIDRRWSDDKIRAALVAA